MLNLILIITYPTSREVHCDIAQKTVFTIPFHFFMRNLILQTTPFHYNYKLKKHTLKDADFKLTLRPLVVRVHLNLIKKERRGLS